MSDKLFVRVKDLTQPFGVAYVPIDAVSSFNGSPGLSLDKYSAKILTVKDGTFSNDKPFVIVEFGTWEQDFLAFRSLFSLMPVGVDLTKIHVPAGEKINTVDGATKCLIFEINSY